VCCCITISHFFPEGLACYHLCLNMGRSFFSQCVAKNLKWIAFIEYFNSIYDTLAFCLFCLLVFFFFPYWSHWNKSQGLTQNKQTDNSLLSFVLMHSFLAGNNLRTFVKFHGLPLPTNYHLSIYNEGV
jgi:hypothetical protein